MPVDHAVHAANRAATERIARLAASITDDQLATRVGEHWTPGVVFAHLAFWDRRVWLTIDASEAAGHVVVVDVDIAANDISAGDAGFAVETNRVTLLFADGRKESLPLMSKSEVAETIVERLAALLE